MLKFERASDLNTPQGAFISWLLSPKSARDVHDWARFMGVRDITPPEEMHSTIIYSPDGYLDSDLHGDRPLPMPIAFSHLNRPRTRIFGQPGTDGCLVTTYDSDQMMARHRFFRDTFGLTSNFPVHIPHVTLSYNAQLQDPRVIQRLTECPCGIPLTFDRERITYPDP